MKINSIIIDKRLEQLEKAVNNTNQILTEGINTDYLSLYLNLKRKIELIKRKIKHTNLHATTKFKVLGIIEEETNNNNERLFNN
jgi:hypothetical protein